MEENYNRKNSKGLVGALSALLLITTAAAVYFWYENNKNTQHITKMDITLDSLDNVRYALAEQVDSLNGEYFAVAFENDSLKGSLENTRELLKAKDNQIWRLNRNAKRDAESLKQEIAALQFNKSELNNSIGSMKAENDELKQANEALTEQVAEMTEKNTNLENQVSEISKANDILETRMAQLIDASFKASGMQVDAIRSNSKSSVKARQIKKVVVGFDLVDVPEEHHGAHTVYLSISDSNGVNAMPGEATTLKVGTETQSVVIEAIDSKKVSLSNSQRIEFNYDVNEKLDKGFYVVSVYTEKGLLGSSILKLF